MLLVNISREKIILQGKGFGEELEYLDIERRFPSLLIDTIEKHAVDTLWVINGPGSATTRAVTAARRRARDAWPYLDAGQAQR